MASTELRELLGRLAPGFFQQAFVVDDIGAAQAAFTQVAGCGTWATLPASNLPYRYRGREVTCALSLAFARSGAVQIELLHPESGEGIHVEFLERNGPGAHHLGFMVDALDEVTAAAEDAGVEECMAGEFGSVRFRYLDTFDQLGVYVELVEDPEGLIYGLMPWR
jgi:hypothetical protein